MTALHASIAHIPMPPRIQQLPLTENGFPILYFVALVDGKPDLRIMDAGKRVVATTKHLCWLCGQPLGRHMAFVLGPMCCVTRTTSEPGCHYDCAQYAVRACPFLARPHMHRRDANMPESVSMPGYGLKRNPGVAAIWIAKSFRVCRDHQGDMLLSVGDPERVDWYAEGRQATYTEVVESIESGASALWKQCFLDMDRRGAESELIKCFARFLPLLKGLPGRDERADYKGVSDAALMSARTQEIAWFKEHPDDESYIRRFIPGELSNGHVASYVKVVRMDERGDLLMRTFGDVVNGNFVPHKDEQPVKGD